MTILFFSRLFCPHIGGVEKHVYQISKELIKKGHKVIIVTEQLPITHMQLAKKHEIFEGIEIYRIEMPNWVLKNNGIGRWFKKFFIWWWLLKNISIIVNADIVHAHDVFYWYLPFRFLFPFKKIYTTFHGYESYPISKKAIAVRKISEILSNGNICIGDFIKKWYYTNPTIVSYGAVGVKETTNHKPRIAKKESAIFIGRLDEQTGIDMYSKAFAFIRKRYPHFSLTVYGDGEYKKKLDRHIVLKGVKKDAGSKISNYQFAFVSRYLGILEAMAAKRLVIAVYDNPVKRDYLSMTPFKDFIVSTSSVEELGEKVTYYIKHPKEKEDMEKKAYEWVAKQTWGNVINQYIKLW